MRGEKLDQTNHVSLATLLDAHRILMAASGTPHLGGVVRTEQNWVAGNDWHPLAGGFVPPPPQMCRPLLEDLVAYLRGDDHSPMLQAAIAHAQFETIHPFGDGNGRAGRALMYGVLKQRCAAAGMMSPVSLALSRSPGNYIDALREFQSYVGPPDDPARSRALIRWLEVLATAVHQSSTAVAGYQQAIKALQKSWRDGIGGRSRRSVAAAAIELLPATPSVTASTLATAAGFSQRRCADALRRLEAAGVVTGRTVGPSLRVYDADKVFDAFDVMSSTVCDPGPSRREYALVLASPLLKPPAASGKPAAASATAQGSKTALCPPRSSRQACRAASPPDTKATAGICRTANTRRATPADTCTL